MNLAPQLSIEVIYKDSDLIETRIFACNHNFSGSVNVYHEPDGIKKLSNMIKGFPKTCKDNINYEAGYLESYAYCGLYFYCIDSSGHTAVRVKMQESAGSESRIEAINEVSLELLYDPSALDLFQHELKAMAAKNEGTAILYGKKA